MKRKQLFFIASVVVLLLAGGLLAGAQNFQGLNVLQNIASESQSAGKYVINIAFILTGIVGAICLVPAAIKAFKGEAQSKDAITSVGLGLIGIFVILAIIKAVMAFT
jgi:hypothetical protein